MSHSELLISAVHKFAGPKRLLRAGSPFIDYSGGLVHEVGVAQELK